MPRPLVLLHGYSASGDAFRAIRDALLAGGFNTADIDIGNYVSLNNEITIKDIAEGFDRALRNHPILKDEKQEFDALVHSTGMLVIRSWLTNYQLPAKANPRLRRVKHLVGLAPATWGSPQAHKGRTFLGTLVKGNRDIGPDFLNAGDRVLQQLELASDFTWQLAHLDLLAAEPYYDNGPETPFAAVFIGNMPYEGLSAVANEPGSDGTVRWAGCALNTRKLSIDLTRHPQQTARATISKWASNRLEVPMLPVEGRNHSTILKNPDAGMLQLITELLQVNTGDQYSAWLDRARQQTDAAKQKMLGNPGKNSAGVLGEAGQFFSHLLGRDLPEVLEGWQQFVVHVRDERGDPVTDYMFDVLTRDHNDASRWVAFEELYTDVHAYGADQSYRCFQIRLPPGISKDEIPLRVRLHASTGTTLMAYQGYAGEQQRQLTETSQPVELDLGDLGGNNGSLFYPFTTTMIEIILNREPLPFNGISPIFHWLP